jgi:hypothetical protein
MPWTAEPYLRTDKPERSDVALVHDQEWGNILS